MQNHKILNIILLLIVVSLFVYVVRLFTYKYVNIDIITHLPIPPLLKGIKAPPQEKPQRLK